MLSARGLRGTFYGALGLMGQTTVVGQMFDKDDAERLVAEGHELALSYNGSHPMLRCYVFELASNCAANRSRAAEVLSDYRLRNFSFPEGVVTLSAKRTLSLVYDTCRTIEPGINTNPIDLGFLRANRVYSNESVIQAKDAIRDTVRRTGWLILYTHDMSTTPSSYGCTPKDFADVLDCAISSGADILPVTDVADRLAGVSEPLLEKESK